MPQVRTRFVQARLVPFAFHLFAAHVLTIGTNPKATQFSRTSTRWESSNLLKVANRLKKIAVGRKL